MRGLSASLLAIAATTACVRAPARLDVQAMVAARGPTEARRDLVARVLADPRDVQAHLALAALADKLGRPSEAIDHLEAVERLGGPISVRWHADDRARLGRLILARARARLARAAPTALADFERAASLGARGTPDELVSARVALATVQLRHVDEKIRAQGRTTLAAFAKPAKGGGTDESSWLGARPTATPRERGAFGIWLWANGARREAYEQLDAWHASKTSGLAGSPNPPDAINPSPTAASPVAPRDDELQAAYLRALAWWSPVWLGEVPPPPADELVGPARCWFPGATCPPPPPEALALPPVENVGPPLVTAAARYAAGQLGTAAGGASGTAAGGEIGTAPGGASAVSAQTLAPIARAYARDPAIADRLALDLVATSADAALAHAALGSLFDALGDPPRARIHWQAAVDASAEPAFLRGLAEAIGRAGDGPAALVYGTTAAAASGDPAVVWTAVSGALLESRQTVEALVAAHDALDLAGPETLPRALDLAIEESTWLGRTAQAEALGLQRAELAPHGPAPDADATAALAAHQQQPTASTAADLWVASRAHPRNIPLRAALLAALDTDDPRRATIVDELVALAGDDSPERAYAAVSALRAK